MLSQLDIDTLAVAAIALFFLHFLLIAFFQTFGAGFPGGRYWVLSLLAFSVAVLLLVLRPYIDSRIVAIFVPNTMLVMALIFVLRGICQFLRRPMPWLEVGLLCGYFFLAYIYLVFFNDQIIARTVVMASVTCSFYVIIAIFLLRNIGKGYRRSRWFAGMLFIALFINDVFRVFWLFHLLRTQPEAVADELMRLVFFSGIFAAPLITFALIALTAEAEIQESRSMERELQQARVRMAEAKVKQQRELLLRDLHDELAGSVAAMGMHARLLENSHDATVRQSSQTAIISLSRAANREIRTMMNQLEKDSLTWQDWLHRIEAYVALIVDGSDIAVRWHVENFPADLAIDFPAGISLQRILKEAVSNAVRHSKATELTISLVFHPGHMAVTIADNGNGLSADHEPSRGMKHMRERTASLGGQISFDSQIGMVIRITVPMPIQVKTT